MVKKKYQLFPFVLICLKFRWWIWAAVNPLDYQRVESAIDESRLPQHGNLLKKGFLRNSKCTVT